MGNNIHGEGKRSALLALVAAVMATIMMWSTTACSERAAAPSEYPAAVPLDGGPGEDVAKMDDNELKAFAKELMSSSSGSSADERQVKGGFGQELISSDGGTAGGWGFISGGGVGGGMNGDNVGGGTDANNCWYRCASRGINYCRTIRTAFLRKGCLHASGKGCNMYCGGQPW
ncbi:unnamed protein product [Cuscuta europaea]|uniref:Uncharacterized protein n=1 Tax=Cuscuta europaea TaxID=41803 RepID=A0A9P0VRZ5_CUSEU|nr:unnamed protein product [Cuscuta europaea]